ncbi:hypothetical protein [Novosphingobium sp. TH158]|uniref:hypothetical protein n=1 Tax=Novosphingobium sp. TH158 TaxID=2067455 RepID=UPI000C7B413B|nr:hypothetical protein [Novosphingobium sp. TH158]PLK26540.1 hypothetical protein C0V78_06290 [Novosphingobium sp. TH158]
MHQAINRIFALFSVLPAFIVPPAAAQPVATKPAATAAKPASPSGQLCFLDVRKVEDLMLSKAGVGRDDITFRLRTYEDDPAYKRAMKSFEVSSSTAYNRNRCVALVRRNVRNALDLTPEVVKAIETGRTGKKVPLVHGKSEGFCSANLEGAGGGVDQNKLMEVANALLKERKCTAYVDEGQVFGGAMDPSISITKAMLIRIEALRPQGTAANRPCDPAAKPLADKPMCYATGKMHQATMREARPVKSTSDVIGEDSIQFFGKAGDKVRITILGDLPIADPPIWATLFGPYKNTTSSIAMGREKAQFGLEEYWREFVIPATGNYSTNLKTFGKAYGLEIAIVG